MKRISKREVILKAIIQEYLKFGEPIGSHELQMKMNLEISPSTIRIYLKRLSEEGSLVQLHVSSGRVPTNEALIEYWKEKIEPAKTFEICSIEGVKESVKEYGIFCTVEKSSKELLKEIVDVNKRFLVLVFNNHEVVLKYSTQIERFLSNLIGCEMRDLKNISAQVGLYELYDKLHQIFSHSYLLRAGEDEVYAIAKEKQDSNVINSLLRTQFSFGLQEGVYFDGFVPGGCLAIKQLATVRDDQVSLFCFGKIDSDFEGFLNKTRSKNESR